MDLLCSFPFLTPERYLRLLRLIPLLGTLEIGFELIGEETFRENAGRVELFQKRINAWNLPEKIVRLAGGYLNWGWYFATLLLDGAILLTGGLFDPFGTYRNFKRRLENERKAEERMMDSYLNLLKLVDDPPPGEEPIPPQHKKPGYAWTTHVLLGVVTFGGLWALLTVFPPLVRAGIWLTETIFSSPESSPWYNRIFNDFISFAILIVLASLVVAGFTALVYCLGWVFQWLVLASLWLFVHMLEKVAALLAHKRAYKVLLSLTLLATVLSVFLPNELECL
jgi:hypothetical protein